MRRRRRNEEATEEERSMFGHIQLSLSTQTMNDDH